MAASYRCGTARRRAAVRDADPPTVNGIDYLEVGPDQLTLELVFLHDLPGGGGAEPVPAAPALTVDQVTIDGGTRIRGIHVTSVTASADRLTVVVDAHGDYSTYALRLRASATDESVPEHYDPQLASVDFSFKAGCPNPLDCKTELRCPPESLDEPELDYLAKDYASFRRLMLDRMAALAPDWRERSPADAHVALVELLAYAADGMSYQQDAAATEAYLGTARRRISLRRHARLLDYRVDSGCNARAWVVFEAGAGADGATIQAHPDDPSLRTVLLTSGDGDAHVAAEDIDEILADEHPVVFEPMHDLTLRSARNGISLYTWSDQECCLPAGTTRATLRNEPQPKLAVGDVLLLEEIVGAATGEKADADRSHRHPVRLTSVVATLDPLDDTPILEVEWATADALPFPLCISALVAEDDGTLAPCEVAVARGNVLLVDHGLTLPVEPLLPATVPEDRPFRPVLARRRLTFAAPYDPELPAAAAMRWEVGDALPRSLVLEGDGETWSPVFDLLGSDRFAPDVVVEVESDGEAQLRFGEGERGRRPQPGADFQAAYRIGNGRAGNVGAESIARAVTPFTGLQSVRNPLPATGGKDPEALERIRLDAPEAFRRQERAVTEADYAQVTERHAEVQRAAAAFRWTGSWYTTFVTVDRLGGEGPDPDLERELVRFLDRYRMAGHDLELEPPVLVPLDLALDVCVQPGVFRADVEQRLLERLSSRTLPDGMRGFFHPDEFTFGKPVFLSRIYAVVQETEGVRWVKATRFQRFGKEAAGELEAEVIELARTEVARLDNDPSFQENGMLELTLKGGL
jgi:Baseplate J-like protein